MCGIAGLFCKIKPAAPSALAPCLSILRHRGPDDEGMLVFNAATKTVTPLGGDDTPAELGLRHWRDASELTGNILLGHRRLSILDLSPRGHQPMVSVDGTCWIAFNGEIYNYVELRDELRTLGHEFHTGTDTEVILHAWQQWGKACLHRFNGDWAFCILDTRGKEPFLFIARDRYGIKPLFYADTPDGFWFASEAKALVGPAVPFKPREHAVVRFLFGGELPPSHGSETFFENICQLPPGEAITVRSDGIERLLWYDLKWVTRKLEKPDAYQAVTAMAEHVDAAVKLRLRADVPVGSCLSGGVDSSSIVGTMRSLFQKDGSSGEVHTFSAIYKEKGNFNEVDWIKDVVDHSKTHAHYVLPDDVPLTEQFDRMVWHQDEPFQTASIFAQWCVMQKARQEGVIVLLDGQAADELFGGYQPGSYQEQFLDWLQTGRYRLLLKEWVARKFATRHSWFDVLREAFQVLANGVTGLLWVDFKRFYIHHILKNSALRKEVVDRYFPPSPPPFDNAQIDLDEAATHAKLAEHREKLARWTEKRDGLKKKKRNSGEDWEQLVKRIAEKREHIRSNEAKLQYHQLQRKLVRQHGEDQVGAPAARWRRLKADIKRAWKRIQGEPEHHFRDYLLNQTTNTSLPILLRFEDRNSMAFSVEARVPFTDHRLVEWAFKSANDFKIHKGWAKWVLRVAMKGRAPESILWRRDKTGFETPDITMTRRLIEHRDHHPADSEFLCRYLEPDLMRETCKRLSDGTGTRDDGRLVWRWLVADSWHEQFTQASQSYERTTAEAPSEESLAMPKPSPETLTTGSTSTTVSDPGRKRILIVAFSPIAIDARVQRQARMLSRKHDVTVAGFDGNPFTKPGDQVQYFELLLDDPGREVPMRKQRIRLRLAPLFPSMLEAHKLEVPHFRHAWHLVQSSNFDLIYCNDVDTLLLGIEARRENPKTKFILDLHEHPTREMDDGSGREGREWLKIRKPLVTGIMKNFGSLADGNVTVVESFVPLFVEEFGMTMPLVVYNAPDLVPLPPRVPRGDGKVRLIHHGACSAFRKLEHMIHMMAWLDDRFTLDFMLVGGEPWYIDYLRREAAKLRPGRVNFRPPVAPGDIVNAIKDYDIGVFLLMPDIFNYVHALPNKFFDFISAGLGVAIGPTPNMARLAIERGIGWVSPDFEPENFAAMLNSLTAEDIAAKQAASYKLRETLNAETEMSKLAAYVDEVLAQENDVPG